MSELFDKHGGFRRLHSFEETGGSSERPIAKRIEAREKDKPASPNCPLCGKPMRHRSSARGGLTRSEREDRDVALRGLEVSFKCGARCRSSGWRSPPAVPVRLRCSRDSMAATETAAARSGKRAAEREAERGRGVKRSPAQPTASEDVHGQSPWETGRRDLPCGPTRKGELGSS